MSEEGANKVAAEPGVPPAVSASSPSFEEGAWLAVAGFGDPPSLSAPVDAVTDDGSVAVPMVLALFFLLVLVVSRVARSR